MGMVWVYLIVLAAFLVFDAIVLKFFMHPLFERYVGELFRAEMQLGVAFVFYLFYVAGLIYLAVLPALAEGALSRAVVNGAVLGFLAYGTYEATNMATLRGWSFAMVAADVSWGTILTATLAAIGYGAARWLL